MLTACVSGTPSSNSYIDRSGKTTIIENDREMCVCACNRDYERCMESGAAQNSGVNGPSGMFGASADCRRDLKDCLPSCKDR